MPGPRDDDLSLLIEAARAGGEIAMRFWRKDPQVWDKDDGAGPVTEADFAVDNMLRETLCAARPDYGWLSEETEDSAARLSNSSVFVIDPIDGTRAFVAGETPFALSLAVVTDGVPTAAAVFLPAKDKLYAAALGGGATLNGAPISVALPGAETRLLATKPNFDPKHWPGGLPVATRHFRPSLAYRLALVAEGAFDGMLTLRDAWEWDIAAGAL
ncbi:MAG: myo-inositol-1(or 4)-monophosphatase, partial [Dinoroseobacter sp.]